LAEGGRIASFCEHHLELFGAAINGEGSMQKEQLNSIASTLVGAYNKFSDVYRNIRDHDLLPDELKDDDEVNNGDWRD
jgi:hypothetical protein